jgi:hypothetical protein
MTCTAFFCRGRFHVVAVPKGSCAPCDSLAELGACPEDYDGDGTVLFPELYPNGIPPDPCRCGHCFYYPRQCAGNEEEVL